MTTVRFNVTKMFRFREPWDCSNNAATMGDQCGRITWDNALRVARDHEAWLVSPLADACEYARDWARDTGAWYRDELAEWDEYDCLALLVQNVASDLRMLGSDDNELSECVDTYINTDWEQESEYPTTSVFLDEASGNVFGEVYNEYCSWDRP